MGKKLFEQYTYYDFQNKGKESLRTGYHIWYDEKWLMNFSSFVKLNNPRIKVPKSNYKEYIDFNCFIHDDISPRQEIDDSRHIIKYNSKVNEVNIYSDNSNIKFNNNIFRFMCKMNNQNEFYYLTRSHTIYLYTWSKNQYDYEFQGMLLGLRR
jgi:hypothetical protein